MSKDLTIKVDDDLYAGLMELVGEKNVGRYIQAVLRSYLKSNSSETYDVKLPVKTEGKGFNIHSPRLADRSLASRFQIEMTEELENGKI